MGRWSGRYFPLSATFLELSCKNENENLCVKIKSPFGKQLEDDFWPEVN